MYAATNLRYNEQRLTELITYIGSILKQRTTQARRINCNAIHTHKASIRTVRAALKINLLRINRKQGIIIPKVVKFLLL